jgi:hypothetical protein
MKEEIPKKEKGPSEEETVRGWIAELDQEINEMEIKLKFASRQAGNKTEYLQPLSEKLNALRRTREEYKALLGSAKP